MSKKIYLVRVVSVLIVLSCALFWAIKDAKALFALPYFNINVTVSSSDVGSYLFAYDANDNGHPVPYSSGEFSIDPNSGVNNYSINLVSWSNGFVKISGIDNVDWKIDSVVCDSSNPNVSFEYFSDNFLIHTVPYNTTNCAVHVSKISKQLNPVIVIPGLMGSAQKDGKWVIDPIFHVYDNLIDTLKLNGYEEGKNLFTFPYEWRQSNATSSIELEAKISEVKNICKCEKVDLVAHSMGGLVARAYVQSQNYHHDVDKLIFLGTPHLGAATAYLAYEAGESAKDIVSKSLKYLLTKEAKKAGYLSLLAYIQAKPISSFRELLPTYDYLLEKSSTTPRSYPDNYPRNNFTEELNNNVHNLLTSEVELFNFVGNTGTSTINTIRVVPSTMLPVWRHGMPDGFYESSSSDGGLELAQGDGTVSLKSAKFINQNLTEFSSEHTDMPTNSEKVILEKLTGQTPTNVENKHHVPNVKILITRILSPADIVVVAPDGKRIGKDFTTGAEINEIEGAFYSGYKTDDEYVTIPDPVDGEYKILTQGTGAGGEYTLVSGIVGGDNTVESSFVAETKPGLITPHDIEVGSNSVIIKPVDEVPPSISIVSPQMRDYVRGEQILISATSTDQDSGVVRIDLGLNELPVINNTSIDSSEMRLGKYIFSATSTDYVHNVSNSNLQFRIVATAKSTIADVERMYSLGQITKKEIKNDIISKLNKAIRIEKRISILEEKLPLKPKVVKRIEILEERLDVVLGRALLKDLTKNHPKFMNDTAYNLLVEDINWLMTN